MKSFTMFVAVLLVVVAGLAGYLVGASTGDMNKGKLDTIVAMMDKDETMKMIRDGSFQMMVDEYQKGMKDGNAEEILMKNGVSEKTLMFYRDMPDMMKQQMKQLDDAVMMK